MAKLTRVIQKVFGSLAGVNQIGQFGSLAAGSPTFTTDPTVIQNLSNYLTGWFGAVVGGNSPAIEDMNALCFLFARQLAYLMQAGVPEWEVGTTYYKGSLVNNGGGVVYVSLTDNNTGNALTSTANWRTVSGPSYDVIVGSEPFCTHADLASAVADTNVGANIRVLLVDNYTVNSTINLTKARWRIEGLPNVTYSKGTAANGISCQADGIEFRSVRFAGWTTAGNKAITGTSAWTYGRVLFCNFNGCDTEIDDSNSPAGKKPVTLGNISE